VGSILRVNLPAVNAQQIFLCQDDLIFALPEEEKPPVTNTTRPQPLIAAGAIQYQGNYSWFLTVTPSLSEVQQLQFVPLAERTHFVVSAVVCYRRDFQQGEQQYSLASASVGLGGGDIIITPSPTSTPPLPRVRLNEWVGLCGGNPAICLWYRVVGISSDGTQLSLAGPDWTLASQPTTLLTVGKSVIGVYSEVIDVDQDLIWQQ
jgi:hypothetical protein